MCFLKTQNRAWFTVGVFQGLTSRCSLKSRRCRGCRWGAVLSQDLCLLSSEATGYVYVRPFARLFLEVAARLFEAKGVPTVATPNAAPSSIITCDGLGVFNGTAVEWTEGIPKAIRKRQIQESNRTEQNRNEKRSFPWQDLLRMKCCAHCAEWNYHVIRVQSCKVFKGADFWGESHSSLRRAAGFDLCRLLFSQHLLKAMPTRPGWAQTRHVTDTKLLPFGTWNSLWTTEFSNYMQLLELHH